MGKLFKLANLCYNLQAEAVGEKYSFNKKYWRNVDINYITMISVKTAIIHFILITLVS